MPCAGVLMSVRTHPYRHDADVPPDPYSGIAFCECGRPEPSRTHDVKAADVSDDWAARAAGEREDAEGW